jgi:peptidoglycan/xylan/chitin deacetylase (PgdA/CDA1 family)
LTIFTYHRVLAEPDPLLADEPDARVFRDQIGWLAKYCNVLALPDAAARLKAGTLPDRAATITFDDGYANNVDVALPILAELGVTATIFVAVDAVRRGIMWNDLAIEALRRAPDDLDLGDYGLGRVRLASDSDRARLVPQLLDRLKYLPLEERFDRAQALYEHATRAPAPRLMLTPDAVRRAASAGMDIGSHTVHHPILATLDDREARAEIEQSRDLVAEMAGVPPKSFAYPNGRPGRDYNGAHVAMVEDCGFELAVSTSWGCASRGSARFELPRIPLNERTESSCWTRVLKTYVQSYANR